MTISVNKFHIYKFLRNSILISLALLQFSCGEKVEIHISKTIIFEGKLYKLDHDEPYSGKVYNTYPSGNREYEGEYNGGKPNGLLIYWFDNGNKMREGKLRNGSPIGRWKYYNQEGNLTKTIDH